MRTVLSIVFIVMMQTAASAQALISITPQTCVQSSFDPITVTVEITGVTELYASTIELAYDRTILKVVSFEKGNFLENNEGNNTIHYASSPLPNDGEGTFTVDQVILGQSSSTGSGILFKLVIVPIARGASTVSIVSARLRNIENTPINYTTVSGLVTVTFADVNLSVILEGAFSGAGMRTSILSRIPVAQPYSVSPWNYNGSETVLKEFFTTHTDIVDWVLVEMRTTTLANSIAAKRAGFVKNNGDIVDVDGVSPLRLSVPINQSYYIVVRHRNHLPVMSAAAVPIGSSLTTYNFTTSMAQAYGSGAMKLLSPGVYGLYAGESNADGRITGTDFNLFYPEFNAVASGYARADFNLDGRVTGTDFNYFYENYYNIRMSRVPD